MPIRSLFLSGGGTLAISILGTLSVLEEVGYVRPNQDIEHYAGVSFGAIISFCLVLGLKVKDILALLYQLDMTVFRLQNVCDIIKLIENFGIDNGEKLLVVFRTILQDRLGIEDVTFGRLFELTGKHLIIQAVNLSTGILVTFSALSSPDMSVTAALRMSTSIPYVFEPVKYDGHIYVDGAIISNFPLLEEINKYYDIDNDDVLAIRFINHLKHPSSEIRNIVEYTTRLMLTVYNNVDRELYYSRLIDIVNTEIQSHMTSFTIDEFKDIVMLGRKQAVVFLEENSVEETSADDETDSTTDDETDSAADSTNNYSADAEIQGDGAEPPSADDETDSTTMDAALSTPNAVAESAIS